MCLPHSCLSSTLQSFGHERQSQSWVRQTLSQQTGFHPWWLLIKKGKDEIKICINPRYLNTALERSHHPICTMEEVAALMSNATVFLDAKNSFWQVSLDHKSSMLTTLSSCFGLYAFIRIPSGLSSASEVFQLVMGQIVCHHCWWCTHRWQNCKRTWVLNHVREVNLQLPTEPGHLCGICFYKWGT